MALKFISLDLTHLQKHRLQIALRSFSLAYSDSTFNTGYLELKFFLILNQTVILLNLPHHSIEPNFPYSLSIFSIKIEKLNLHSIS